MAAIIGEGNGNPLQYSCLENPMDGGAWEAAVRGVTKSQTWLSDFTFTFHFHALEKEMATHSSVLAWRIPGTGEPGGLPSKGSQSQTRLKRLSSSSRGNNYASDLQTYNQTENGISMRKPGEQCDPYGPLEDHWNAHLLVNSRHFFPLGSLWWLEYLELPEVQRVERH